jgi:hypothetical protein
MWLRDNSGAEDLDLTFSITEDRNGSKVTIDLIKNGRNIPVDDSNKDMYIEKVVEHITETKIDRQAECVRQGLYAVVPRDLLELFNDREFSLLICGTPEFNAEEWRGSTKYNNHVSEESAAVINWFWVFLDSLSRTEKGLLFRFCTGSSRLPVRGFAGLSPKFNITLVDYDKKKCLPTAATCFNQLKLPKYVYLLYTIIVCYYFVACSK